LIDTPKIDADVHHRVLSSLTRWVAAGDIQKWTPQQVLEHKQAPGLRRRYEQAFKELSLYGLHRRDLSVKAFIKVEKWAEEQLGVKPARLIQYRSYKYCAALSQYLCPIEKLMWTTLNWNGQPVFSKGRNSYQTAEMLFEGWNSLSKPMAYLIDHSKFDSSVRSEHIGWETKVYTSMYPDDELRTLMGGQYRNRCHSKGGIAYECTARKMSGEYNTSLGDSIINYGVLRDVFGDKAIFVINGDDSVVMVERGTYDDALIRAPATWAKYGFKSVVEVVTELEQVDFCQSKPIQVDGKWRMVRNPWRAVSRSSCSVRRYQGEAWRKLLAAMADSELACSDGVPMLQAWALYLRRCSAGASPLPGEISYRARLESKPVVRGVMPSTRDSFAIAFGVDPHTQLEFEQWCERQPAVCLQSV
jgi:hypothetical protein